jgi:hypothetical protein
LSTSEPPVGFRSITVETARTANAFSTRTIAVLEGAKILGVRSGTEHRPTGVWVVVVNGRVFARSWSDKQTGWFRAFMEEPRGAIQIPTCRQIRVRARKVRGERLLDSIDAAYAAKYDTRASQKWVRGFAEPKRRATTLEFLPVARSSASPRS